MRATLFRLWVVLAAALFACPVAAQPDPSPPRDEGAFVKYVAGRIARVSGTKVEPADRLSLNVSATDGSPLLTANLDRVWSACQRLRERCAAFVDEYVASVSSMIDERSRPPQKEALRIIIRPKSYLESVKGDDAAHAPLARPFMGDLAAVLVIDGASSLRSAQREDLAALKLSEDEAFELAKQNLRTRELKPLDAVLKPITGKAIGYLEENAYESSRLLLHEDWKKYAGEVGTLIVAVPATNFLIYGSGANPEATGALRALALDVARKSQRPLSPLLFRWRPQGWEIVR
jgi:uncharacterized protein YtpQ (UPF0354 family)